MKAKVGILLPAFNTEKYIEEAFVSVVQQIYPNIAVYVCNDKSTDKTLEVIESFGKHNYLHVYKNARNLGWSKTVNKLARFAIKDNCKYIFTMNADDIMAKDCIEKCVQTIQNSNYWWVSFHSPHFGAEMGPINTPKSNCTIEEAWDACPLASFVLIRSDIWQQFGGYDTKTLVPKDMKWGYEDWELWIRLLQAGGLYCVIPQNLYHYRIHEKQSHKEPAKRADECYQLMLKKHGKIKK